jgi:secreted trypsin-like serine protease
MSGQARVFGGDEVRIGQFPYLVFIVFGRPSALYCTGSIISKTWVLTAAHCVEPQLVPPEKIKIYAGIVSYYDQPFQESKQFVQGKRVVVHPEYVLFNVSYGTDVGSYNDVGLIETSTAFVFNNYVGSVPVASMVPLFGQAHSCKAMGFGHTEEGSTKKLKFINVNCLYRCTDVPDEELNTLYQTDDYVCSYAGPGAYVYNGDSGSPLICNGTAVAVCFWVKYVSEQIDRIMLHTSTAKFVHWIASHVPDVVIWGASVQRR